MGYYLGVDIGTTYTAAAVWRDGRCEVSNLGNRAPTIPSVVFLRDDGDRPRRRGRRPARPHRARRVAREFKRRVGDPTPVLVGGTPYSADALMARLLRGVVDHVSGVEGGAARAHRRHPPGQLGPLQARPAAPGDPASPTSTTSSRRHRARGGGHPLRLPGAGRTRCGHRRLRPRRGHVRRRGPAQDRPDGFDVLGTPEGIERLGGIDFDAAVFDHVASALGAALDDRRPDDPAALAAVARLRESASRPRRRCRPTPTSPSRCCCPALQTEVRLTRSEFEQMVRPALADTIDALHAGAALGRGRARPTSRAVLLVGGSSRIPLVAELVSSAPRPAGGRRRPPQVRRGARRRHHRRAVGREAVGGRQHLRRHASGRGRRPAGADRAITLGRLGGGRRGGRRRGRRGVGRRGRRAQGRDRGDRGDGLGLARHAARGSHPCRGSRAHRRDAHDRCGPPDHPLRRARAARHELPAPRSRAGPPRARVRHPPAATSRRPDERRVRPATGRRSATPARS